ncbi:hypothetical protein GCM10010176_088730 [Nonomuraea spiralis]|nr:hypothetical protein GCM10010176_088730 [Nonomuraea spiralis]
MCRSLDQVVRLFWQREAEVTGIAGVVQATGVSRSSLYATFGGKAQLQAAALDRYLERQSRPVLDALVTNTHATASGDAPQIREILDRHHDAPRAAMRAARTPASSRRAGP